MSSLADPFSAGDRGRSALARRRLRLFFGGLCLAAAAAGDGPETATVAGRIADDSGAPLAGLEVTLGSERGERLTATGPGGEYRFARLAPGRYRLGLSLPDAGTVERPIEIATGQRLEVDLVVGREETIRVTAEAPQVERFEAATRSTVGPEVAGGLATSHRNYHSLTYLMPGVVHSANSQDTGDHRPSVNGGLWQENAVFIEGVDSSYVRRGGSSRLFLPSTATAEVRMDGAGLAAEYGRFTGGVTRVVTRSGTNTLHGDLLLVAQNRAWRAQSEHVPIARDDDGEIGFEAALGGPIVRDRAWFLIAGAEGTTNQIDVTRDGTAVDASVRWKSRLLKLELEPGARHSIALTGTDAPAEQVVMSRFRGDLFTVPSFALGGELLTANWNWSATPNRLLETRIASQRSTEDRRAIARRTLDPSRSPHSPFNSHGRWEDRQTGFHWNGFGPRFGEGDVDFPRDQANLTLGWFLGSHELRLGVDLQNVAYETVNRPPDAFFGRGYDPELPGGFERPETLRRFLPAAGTITTRSRSRALFAQDRLRLGGRLTAILGLRLDAQEHENDIGEVVTDSTDLAPRLAAIYELDRSGRLLFKATAGRYYHHITQNIVNQEAARTSNGANAFDELRFNPQTGLYDLFLRRVLPDLDTRFDDLDPYFKDELTAGVDWQLASAWRLTARALYWRLDDLFWATDQIATDRTIFRIVRNFDAGERDYRGFQLAIDRRLRGDWTLTANYTLGRADGNVFGNTVGTLDDDDFLEAMAAIDPDSGQPFTANHRHGRGEQDRTHIFNLAAARYWQTGAHRLSLGGHVRWQSGEPWGLRPMLVIDRRLVPGLRGTIRTTEYVEPRDAHRLPDTFTLNLNAGWDFPLLGATSGTLRIELTNLTDRQQQIAVNLRDGEAIAARSSYQQPRELRIIAGVRF